MVKKTTKKVYKVSKAHQTGKSNKAKDRKVKAKHPGKRVSKKGKTYYEHRKNRSDKDRRKRL